MDYLSIVLNGFCDEVARHYLKDYFIRQYKEAEKQHYTADEFFFGCNTAIKKLESEMQRSLHERKRELYVILDWQKRGMNGSADTPKPLTEENHTAIADIQAELKELSKQNFPVNLSIHSQNRYLGHLYWEDTVYISTQIQLAYKEIKNPAPTRDYEEEKRLEKLGTLANTLKMAGLRGDNLEQYYQTKFLRWRFDNSDEVWMDDKLLTPQSKKLIKGVGYNIQPAPIKLVVSDKLNGSELTESRFIAYELEQMGKINPTDLAQSFNLDDYKAFLETKKAETKEQQAPPPEQENGTLVKSKSDIFKEKLSAINFLELPTVKGLSEENQGKLMNLLSEETMPYCIAMFDYLGFLKYLEQELYPTKDKLNKELSKIFNSDKDGRAVKGNINSLNQKTNESKQRYTAHSHKETVKKDYEALK